MLKVAIIYHMWPHYRRAVMHELDRSTRVNYTFVGSGEPFEGIAHVDTASVRRFERLPFRTFGPFVWQAGAIKIAAQRHYDVLIFLGNPNALSTWLAAAIAKICGTPVIFWEHGWRKREAPVRRTLRRIFFELAQRVLVYAPRAKQLGAASGYPADRIDVVWNSLDTDRANQLFEAIVSGELNEIHPASFFGDQELPIIICTARMTEKCRFDLLLHAMEKLKRDGLECNALLVGDGPARAALVTLAEQLGVKVHFMGPCYDERTLSQLIYHATLTVSPGKIGLTAMHSLMYGTPAITHDNDDDQMPEVEAIQEGRTGARFRQGDAGNLATAILSWLRSHPDREAVRRDCRSEIAKNWTPQGQFRIIERAIDVVLAGREGLA